MTISYTSTTLYCVLWVLMGTCMCCAFQVAGSKQSCRRRRDNGTIYPPVVCDMREGAYDAELETFMVERRIP